MSLRRRVGLLVAVIGGLLAVSGGFVGVAVATETAPECSTVSYTQNGSEWNEVENVSQLQCISANGLSEDYVLIGDIDASGTNQWNGGAGFEPIGDKSAPFTGSFDGAGHTITTLTIDRPTENYVGLFSKFEHATTVEKVVIDDANITGNRVVGGLVGRNAGTVHNVTVTGNITGTRPDKLTNVGAIVGRHDAEGRLVDVNASGTVTGNKRVGGIVGVSRGAITRAHTTVDVTASGKFAGGVVGYAKSSTISRSNASVTVSGIDRVGGLVGSADQGSVINSSNASGVVSAAGSVGGLVGYTNGTVTASTASGAVSGSLYVGGVVGIAGQSSKINRSSASGNVLAREYIAGGLVGYLEGTVERSTASGDIEATETDVGGLVGYATSESSITRSNATGTVSGEERVGGLVGVNYGAVNTSYAIGGVTGGQFVGGLIGHLEGTVEDTYAAPTAAIRGDQHVGGLIGYIQDTGRVNRSFATGLVRATGSRSGGITSDSLGAVSDSYWNTETTNQSSSGGGIPLTTVQMTGDDAFESMSGLDDTVWSTVDDSTAGSSGDGYPVLAALPLDPQILVPTRENDSNDGGGSSDSSGSNDEDGSSDSSGSNDEDGSSGGGGSGSDSATSPLAETVHTQTLEHTTLNEVAIDFAEPVDGLVHVTVVEAPDRPTIESSATVVGAVSITPPRESTETNATLAFTLNATALEASEIVPADIVVYRVDTAGTVHDPTTVSVTAETNDTVTVAAETPGFSTFVLATAQSEAETESEAVQSESVTEMTDGSPTEEPHGEPEPTTEASPATIEADNVSIPGFGPLVALVALVMLALAAVERGRNQP